MIFKKNYILKFITSFIAGSFGLFASELINTIAGTGIAGYTGDTGLASSCTFRSPQGIVQNGSIYIADTANNVVRMINMTTNCILTIAGTGTAGYSGNGGAATLAKFDTPTGIFAASNGNIYVADSANHVIRMINSGIISTVAGNGIAGYSGNVSATVTGIATAAQLNTPQSICLDSSGNIYIADTGNNVIRKVDTSFPPKITTYAGTGTAGYSGDNEQAVAAKLQAPVGICIDSSNNLYIADTGNNVIRIVYSTGIINTFVGSGLSSPAAICLDSSNNLYIADTGNNLVRKINTSLGLMSILAGSTPGYAGDGGLALNAKMKAPSGICVNGTGNIYIADTLNNVIRELTLGNIPTPVTPAVTPISQFQTAYIPGPDQNDPSIPRYDTIRIGTSGGFSGYVAPLPKTSKIVLSLQPIAGATFGANSTIMTVAAFPNTIRELWITGDATGFDVACASGLGLQLPTPPKNCDVRFDLKAGPASTCKWFQGTPSNCHVYVEPNCVDPMICGLLQTLDRSNRLIAGSSISLGTNTFVSCNIQRHPKIPVTSAYSRALLTIGANIIFQAAINGMSLTGPYVATFNQNSDLVDPNPGAIPVNYIVAEDKTLTLYGCHAPLPTYVVTLQSGAEDVPVVNPVPLPPLVAFPPI